ncbi:MAG: hypothetical protein ABH832_02835 [bacterium]
MADFIHQDMAKGRWFKMSLCEQLGNAGSEVGRAIKWHNKGNIEQRNRAIDRALDLLDLTITDKRWRNRLSEITRGRALLADLFYGKNEFNSTHANMESYYYHFALASRANR